MSRETLQVQGLQCAFPDFKIEADFHVGPEERVAIFSPSGTGKSTLIRVLAGWDTGASLIGEVKFRDQNLLRVAPEVRNLGVVFQEGYLFPQMTALENVAYPLKLRGVARAERTKLAEQWLQKLQLGARLNRFPQELSGGERQRVAFARALVFQPRAILLDEAFSAMDLKLRESLATILIETQESLKIPMIFVTHDAAERDRLATRVLQYRTDEEHTRHRFTD